MEESGEFCVITILRSNSQGLLIKKILGALPNTAFNIPPNGIGRVWLERARIQYQTSFVNLLPKENQTLDIFCVVKLTYHNQLLSLSLH